MLDMYFEMPRVTHRANNLQNLLIDLFENLARVNCNYYYWSFCAGKGRVWFLVLEIVFRKEILKLDDIYA